MTLPLRQKVVPKKSPCIASYNRKLGKMQGVGQIYSLEVDSFST